VRRFAIIGWCLFTVAAAAADTIPPAYTEQCSSCHGAERLGLSGPALLPGNLTRVKPAAAARTIRDGLPATQMPAFGNKLSEEQIGALVDFIYTPLAAEPRWGREEIAASHVQSAVPAQDSRGLADTVDPLNLFVVVESGDHHVSILDGDRLEPIHRFKSRHALHGGPKFSPDGRFVYFASRDGWISKFDLHRLAVVAEIRAGINTRNLAVSSDGRYVMVANYLPHTLVVLDSASLSLLELIAVENERGESSRVSAVYSAPARQSFIVALKDLKEVWEISYADDPPYFGVVHDYQIEGPPELSERFPVRRIKLDDYLDDFFFDTSYEHLVGASRNAAEGQVVNLHVGRKIAAVDLPGLPHLASGITWEYQGRTVMATPHLNENLVSIVDTQTWRTIKRIETLGPGFFMRSHENSPYAWVDVFFGPNRDAVHIIDKATLEIVATLRPSPGHTAAHVEFTRDGAYALLSLWEMDGAIIVYDAHTLAEVKRIPMVKPSGKYNVYNKISGSRGTSH
jgi:DNA-binding beta-propeller fold protein YncE